MLENGTKIRRNRQHLISTKESFPTDRKAILNGKEFRLKDTAEDKTRQLPDRCTILLPEIKT